MFNKSKIITIAMYLFILSDFIRMVIPGGNNIYDAIIIVTIPILCLSFYLSIKKIGQCKHKCFYYLSVLFCLLLFFLEIRNGNVETISIIAETLCWICLPVLFVVINDKRLFPFVLYWFVFLNSLLAIPSVLNHFIDLPGLTVPGTMFINDGGYYGNRNVNAMINVMSFTICIYLILNNSNRWKYCSVVPLIFNLLCVIFSGSRTSMACLVIIIVVYILKITENKTIKILLWLGLMLVCLIITFYRYNASFISIEQFELFLNSLSSNRYYIWKEALIISKDSLLFGSGINTLSQNCMKYFGESSALAVYNGSLNNCHNLFINILYNSGLIALLYFIGLCVYYLKIIFKNPINLKRLSTLMVVLCGFLISMLDIPLLYTTSVINIIWWLFVFYSVSEA